MWFYIFPPFIWINNVKIDHNPSFLGPIFFTSHNLGLRGVLENIFLLDLIHACSMNETLLTSIVPISCC